MKAQYNTEWKRVLNELYTSMGRYFCGDRTKIIVITNHALAIKLDMPLAELDQHIRFLKDNGLVADGDEWTITKKGFDVSFQNEKIKAEFKSRRAFLVISSMTLLVAVIMMVISVVNAFW